MFSILQLLLVVALIAGVIVYFGKIKKKEKSLIAGLLVGIVMAAVIGNGILSLVPFPTNEVVVTATGEKNDNAKNNEVNIINYIIGGEEYAIKNPTEGKWFWKGDVYMWRNENDSRQPAGTTRSITLNIPYGQDRSVQFGLSEWNGIVEVTYNGESNRYDLFKSGDETTILAQVPDTDSFALYSAKLLRLLLFAAIIGLLVAYPAFCVVKYEYAVIKKFWQKHWDKVYYLVLAVLYVMLLQKNSVGGSLWYDEIWALAWIINQDPNKSYIFFNLISKAWYGIMPYGHEYLRLLSQLFVAGTIYFAGCIGNEYRNKRFGILLSSSVAFSLTIANQCAKGIRPYAMLLFLSTIMLYLYIKTRKDNSKKSILLYSLVLLLTMDTHLFGFMVAGLLMLFDFILIIFKRLSKVYWLEFILPAIYGAYWFSTQFVAGINNINHYSWAGKASLSRLLDAIKWLFCYDTFMMSLALMGLVIILVVSLTKIMQCRFNFNRDYTRLTILSVPVLAIMITFVYSTVFNPNNSMLIDRYFMSIIIFLYFVLCYALDSIIDKICNTVKSEYVEKCLVIFVILFFCLNCWPKITPWETWPAGFRTHNNDYKSAVEYVLQQNDIYVSSTLFILDHPVKDADTGIAYYTTHKGERDDINHCSVSYLPDNIEQYETLYISYVFNRDRRNDVLNNLINTQYELIYDNAEVKVRKYVKI